MKTTKKMMCSFLAVCLTIGMLFIPGTEVSAANVTSSKAHIESTGCEYEAIRVNYLNPGDSIKNIKTNNKNLVAKITSIETSSSADDSSNPGYAYIGLRSKKAGTYKVTFDLYSPANQKLKSCKVTVYANDSTAIKKASFAGKQDFDRTLTTKSSGKFSVSLNKGYTLKGITVGTYTADGDYVTRSIKNNSRVSLGKYAFKSESGYTSSYSNNYSHFLNTRIMAETFITVSYIDKYSKKLETTEFSLYRVAK